MARSDGPGTSVRVPDNPAALTAIEILVNAVMQNFRARCEAYPLFPRRTTGSLVASAGCAPPPQKPPAMPHSAHTTSDGVRSAAAGPVVGSIGGHLTDGDLQAVHAATNRLGRQRSRVDGWHYIE